MLQRTQPLKFRIMNDFKIKLGTITNGKNLFSFKIKAEFFEAFTLSEIKHGEIIATALLDKEDNNLILKIAIEGRLNQLLCDFCADEISVNISGETNIILKITDEDLHSTDEIFYIKKHENSLDLSQLIFELIVLSAPKKKQHPLNNKGESTCNKEMVDLVNKYSVRKEKSSDHRWDALKDLKIK
jgi:uncharacterized metal-binding protein YceD (DUF177 family)